MPSTERDQRPSAFIWLLALISVLLPIGGVALALYGVFLVAKGAGQGYAWLTTGLLVLVVDLIIDTRWNVWARSSQPDLNRRGDQLVGEVVTVIEPIIGGGRGSVRVGDGVWAAEGPDAVAGSRVRVIGCNSTVLTVEPV